MTSRALAHVDILQQRESLRRPLLGSVVFHATVAGLLLLGSWLESRGRIQWGDPKGSGGVFGITPVSQLPLPARGGLVNPVANDTESSVPLPPRTKPTPAQPRPAPAEDAVTLKSRSAKARTSTSQQRYRSLTEERPHQLYSTEGQALSTPMFGGQAGSGGVGVGANSPFGNRYGYYLEILRRRVAEKWRTADVNPRLTSAPPAIVSFEIQRDGTVRGISLLQRSGDATLDYSAQRAIQEAGPFPRLPAGFERSSATIEFWFYLKR